MAFEGLRSKLRSLSGSASDTASDVRREAPRNVRRVGRTAGGAVARRAPATDLEGTRKPSAREEIAQRLQSSGQMRKPIPDANLEPGADPRFMEAFGRGDATSGEWFGESEARRDPNDEFFGGSGATVGTGGDFVMELLDERDHEGGHYAYEDENEEGWLDDGVPLDALPGSGPRRWF